MNKIQLSIYSAIACAIHTLNIYAQDISLFSIPRQKIPNTPEVIADIALPIVDKREIPVRLFDIPSSSVPKINYILNRPKKSVNVLSPWQIVLPIQQLILPSNVDSFPITYEKLSHNFLDTETTFPTLPSLEFRRIVLYPNSINPLYYSINYAPLSTVDLCSRCTPFIQCSSTSLEAMERKEKSEVSSPQLSSTLAFLTPSLTFSIQGVLPLCEIPTISYILFDKQVAKNILCFPQTQSFLDSLQEIALKDDLYIKPNSCITFHNSWQPEWQTPTFSKSIGLSAEIVLPTIHTSISRYIPKELPHPSIIESQVQRPMTFIGPFHYMENFALLPNLEDLRTLSYRDEFASIASAMPTDNGAYYFSITLTPNSHIAFPPIPQTVFFLIDRSSHIRAEQFNSFQRGVIRTLSYLLPNSRFNIAFFDQKISLLHPIDLEIGSDAIQKASAFVRSATKRFLVGASDIGSALQCIQKEDAPFGHTAYILLTNKKSLESRKNAELLSNFIKTHRELCTLYIASIGDNIIDIPYVEESLYSDTHAAFPRRLASLVKNVSFPIANHLKISVITEDPNLHIELFPNSHILYQDKPFIIYGKMDHLKNFQLILQGNNVNSWINITKPIVFTTPSPCTKSLAKHFNKPEKSRL